MKKILVAVDGSEASIKGARTALDLAAQLQGTVTLMYVVPPLVLPGDAPWAPLEEIHEAELKRGERVLGELIEKLGVPEVRKVVKVGPPAETVAEQADEDDSDLVVVGSTGKGMVKRLLVGSTADRLVHICQRPVLVVR